MTSILENIGWENNLELWHLLILFIVLVLGVYWEIRKQKTRLLLRIIALSIAFISLYIIYLSPYTLTQKPPKSILLISQKVDPQIADSITDLYKLEVLYELEDLRFHVKNKQGSFTLNELPYEIDTAFVYGYLPQLTPRSYRVRKDIEIKKGIQVEYPNSIALGDSLKINIQNIANKKDRILATIGNDSISKNIESKGTSTISTFPKSAGYILNSIKTNKEVYHFATRVVEPEHFVIQILSAAPDFEWKFLADYLKKSEHSIYQKTQISTEKFKSSFFNWYDSLQINRGVAKDLKLLFVDAKAWEDLSQSNKNQYLKTLKENRGTIIFRSNPNSKIQLDLDKSKSTNIFSTSNSLLESKNYKYLQFNKLRQLDEVAQNSIFRKVTPYLIYGVINFQNSFQLKLSGKNREYEELWRPIFTKLMRRSDEDFYDYSKWAVQHQPFFFRLWSEEETEQITVSDPTTDTLKLVSKQDRFYSGRKHFMFYPKEKGWHFIKLQNETKAIPIYAHHDSLAMQSEFLSNYNHDYLNYLNFVESSFEPNQKQYNKESRTLWFFLLFIVCVGYLWIEDKIT